MPSPEREEIVAAVSSALAELQAAHDDRDRALAEALGVGRTDLRCLDLIVREGPQTATELGARLHLTRGSMTTLIDRLAHAGYAQRHDDPGHGRRKLIAPTPKLIDTIGPLFRTVRERGHERMNDYTEIELTVVLRFLRATAAGQSDLVEAAKAATV
ncbi:MAG: MarR family winged helix-turn-helix transcriptional regulator [Mycobacteriales bacterium]